MADAPLEKTIISLDDLLAMGEDANIEIIDGEIVEKNMAGGGGEHYIVDGNIYRVLDQHVNATHIGIVFMDGLTYLMFSPTKNLKDSFEPDLSFIRHANIPKDWDIRKPHPGVPDLAVEVISPHDNADDIQRKRRTYLEKGTQEVWIVYPKTRELHQHTSRGVRIYSGSEEVKSDLFPTLEGLTLDVIFKMPSWVGNK